MSLRKKIKAAFGAAQAEPGRSEGVEGASASHQVGQVPSADPAKPASAGLGASVIRGAAEGVAREAVRTLFGFFIE
ncbi:hypothetical protein [Streptomyces sp. NEAU-H3]|uniref:hypothetical protein n=1 Tax=Streptomyces sp. NEAU-H3 TaxID=2720636 RepID=UPI00143C2747|nr:hypothetical protein [Streptomyces sp. NEAU-H3]NJA59178.1 hypothetical protein [Streptomyces sp. NEAU-H3]